MYIFPIEFEDNGPQRMAAFSKGHVILACSLTVSELAPWQKLHFFPVNLFTFRLVWSEDWWYLTQIDSQHQVVKLHGSAFANVDQLQFNQLSACGWSLQHVKLIELPVDLCSAYKCDLIITRSLTCATMQKPLSFKVRVSMQLKGSSPWRLSVEN